MSPSQPITLASPISPARLPAGTVALGGTEVPELNEQVQRGDLTGLRAYLARTRSECDWQDRVLMLQLVTPRIRVGALDFACDTEPEAADVFLIRCCYYSELAWTMRGHGTCDEVSDESFHKAGECIQFAWTAAQKATKLDTQDPTAYGCILPSLTIFGGLRPHQQQAFQLAVSLAPDFVPAYYAVVTSLSKRWCGSHEESLEFARYAMTKAGPGSDMAICLFWAHMLIHGHFKGFDKNPEEAEAYFHRTDVKDELNAAFDSWTQAPYTPRRSSIPHLHEAAFWFYRAGDVERLQRALSLTGNVFCRSPWSWAGNSRKVYAQAVELATGKKQWQINNRDPWKDALALIDQGIKARQERKFLESYKAFTTALAISQTALEEEGGQLIPLILLNASLLRRLQKAPEESQTLRARALTLLDEGENLSISASQQRPMAEILYKLGEYQRAVPFYEQAINASEEEIDPFVLAEMLHNMGESYCRIGLTDHAAVPLRAALKIYRTYPGDPRLPGVLLSLGNALRKSTPSEAEEIYKEAAEVYAAQLQMQSATVPWVNLGILCSEQGRHEEALSYYDRVLRIREQTQGTKPIQIGSVMNNLANCYRRMGRFAEAHAKADVALKVLATDNGALPSAMGTKAQIFLDAGENAEALEWARNAYAAREKQPSPNLSAMAENLECEIAALGRMGRTDEAALAEEKLASIRSAMQAAGKMDEVSATVKPVMEGAVFVELSFDGQRNHLERKTKIRELTGKLGTEAKAQEAGYYSGRTGTTESTTFFFYGQDAERLFQVLEPSLLCEPICAGARVLIRQGNTRREIVVPLKAKSVN